MVHIQHTRTTVVTLRVEARIIRLSGILSRLTLIHVSETSRRVVQAHQFRTSPPTAYRTGPPERSEIRFGLRRNRDLDPSRAHEEAIRRLQSVARNLDQARFAATQKSIPQERAAVPMGRSGQIEKGMNALFGRVRCSHKPGSISFDGAGRSRWWGVGNLTIRAAVLSSTLLTDPLA